MLTIKLIIQIFTQKYSLELQYIQILCEKLLCSKYFYFATFVGESYVRFRHSVTQKFSNWDISEGQNYLHSVLIKNNLLFKFWRRCVLGSVSQCCASLPEGGNENTKYFTFSSTVHIYAAFLCGFYSYGTYTQRV